ncbi:MAG TPA: hypothetical protein VJ891_13250, partial [Casimicrobiaceae bacterium]|nr:hypothetical protein [Casimicrobiaceae bacterium]
ALDGGDGGGFALVVGSLSALERGGDGALEGLGACTLAHPAITMHAAPSALIINRIALVTIIAAARAAGSSAGSEA